MKINLFQYQIITQAISIYNDANSREGCPIRITFGYDANLNWTAGLYFGNLEVGSIDELDEVIEYITLLRPVIAAFDSITTVEPCCEPAEYAAYIESLGLTNARASIYQDNQARILYAAMVEGDSRTIKNFISGKSLESRRADYNEDTI